MPVISAASGKGGCAKTTTLVAITRELAARGFNVAFLDGDPNQHGAMALNLSQRPNLLLIPNVTEDDIANRLAQAKASAEIIFIDLPGIASQLTLWGAAKSDFVLIPCQASRFDTSEALRANNKVNLAGEAAGRRIRRKILWTRIPPGPIKSRMEMDLREDMMKRSIECMSTPLFEFVAFREMMFGDKALSEMDQSRAAKAGLNALAIAAETMREVGVTFPLAMPAGATTVEAAAE